MYTVLHATDVQTDVPHCLEFGGYSGLSEKILCFGVLNQLTRDETLELCQEYNYRIWAPSSDQEVTDLIREIVTWYQGNNLIKHHVGFFAEAGKPMLYDYDNQSVYDLTGETLTEYGQKHYTIPGFLSGSGCLIINVNTSSPEASLAALLECSTLAFPVCEEKLDVTEPQQTSTNLSGSGHDIRTGIGACDAECGNSYKETTTFSIIKCADLCLADKDCLALKFNSSQKICNLYDEQELVQGQGTRCCQIRPRS